MTWRGEVQWEMFFFTFPNPYPLSFSSLHFLRTLKALIGPNQTNLPVLFLGLTLLWVRVVAIGHLSQKSAPCDWPYGVRERERERDFGGAECLNWMEMFQPVTEGCDVICRERCVTLGHISVCVCVCLSSASRSLTPSVEKEVFWLPLEFDCCKMHESQLLPFYKIVFSTIFQHSSGVLMCCFCLFPF